MNIITESCACLDINNNGEMHNSVPVLSLLKPENPITATRTLRFVIPEHSGVIRAGLYLH